MRYFWNPYDCEPPPKTMLETKSSSQCFGGNKVYLGDIAFTFEDFWKFWNFDADKGGWRKPMPWSRGLFFCTLFPVPLFPPTPFRNLWIWGVFWLSGLATQHCDPPPPCCAIGYSYTYRVYVFLVSQGIALYPPPLGVSRKIMLRGGVWGGYRQVNAALSAIGRHRGV